MASNGTNNGTAKNETNAEAGGFLNGEISSTVIQVGEIIIYLQWMLLQGINKNLW